MLILHPSDPFILRHQSPQRETSALPAVAWLTQQNPIGDVVRSALRSWVDVIQLHEFALKLASATCANDQCECHIAGLRLDEALDDLRMCKALPGFGCALEPETQSRRGYFPFVCPNRRFFAIVDIPKGDEALRVIHILHPPRVVLPNPRIRGVSRRFRALRSRCPYPPIDAPDARRRRK